MMIEGEPLLPLNDEMRAILERDDPDFDPHQLIEDLAALYSEAYRLRKAVP